MRRANFRKVLDCASPLVLGVDLLAGQERQRTAGVQDAGALASAHFTFAS